MFRIANILLMYTTSFVFNRDYVVNRGSTSHFWFFNRDSIVKSRFYISLLGFLFLLDAAPYPPISAQSHHSSQPRSHQSSPHTHLTWSKKTQSHLWSTQSHLKVLLTFLNDSGSHTCHLNHHAQSHLNMTQSHLQPTQSHLKVNLLLLLRDTFPWSRNNSKSPWYYTKSP